MPNRERIVEIVREQLPFAQDHFSLARYNPDSARFRQTMASAVETWPGIESVEAVLREELQWPDGLLQIRTSPSSSAGLRVWHLARWLLAQSRQRPVEEVVNGLFEFLGRNSTTMSEILVLWGLHPTEVIDLPKGARLIPIQLLPPSEPLDSLLGIPATLGEEEPAFSMRARPRAALMRDFEHGPVFEGVANVGPGPMEVDAVSASDKNLLQEIAQALVLIGKPVAPIGHWYQAPVDIPLVTPVGAWSGSALEWRFIEKLPATALPVSGVRRVVRDFLSLEQEVKDGLAVPIQRLNQSLKGTALDQVALDLGIALEALLVPDRGDEISFRFRSRGTQLLGGDREQRSRTAKLLKAIYDLRSRPAHGAEFTRSARKLASRLGYEDIRELFTSAHDLAAALIRKVVVLQGFPDWEGVAMGWSEIPEFDVELTRLSL